MFEQAELRGTPTDPNGPPNTKGTAKTALKIAVLGNPTFLVILMILGKTSHFGLFGQP